GGPGDVGEKDGDELALLRVPLDRPERRPAGGAELEALRVFRATVRAGHHVRSLRLWFPAGRADGSPRACDQRSRSPDRYREELPLAGDAAKAHRACDRRTPRP